MHSCLEGLLSPPIQSTGHVDPGLQHGTVVVSTEKADSFKKSLEESPELWSHISHEHLTGPPLGSPGPCIPRLVLRGSKPGLSLSKRACTVQSGHRAMLMCASLLPPAQLLCQLLGPFLRKQGGHSLPGGWPLVELLAFPVSFWVWAVALGARDPSGPTAYPLEAQIAGPAERTQLGVQAVPPPHSTLYVTAWAPAKSPDAPDSL